MPSAQQNFACVQGTTLEDQKIDISRPRRVYQLEQSGRAQPKEALQADTPLCIHESTNALKKDTRVYLSIPKNQCHNVKRRKGRSQTFSLPVTSRLSSPSLQ
jgi:hypothetical protein